MQSVLRASGVLVCVLFLSAAAMAQATLALPAVLGDGMVLQRGGAVPIWGTAAPGAEVTVQFAGQKKTASATETGKWRVDLDKLKASRKSRVLTVQSGETTLKLKNVLVGEVWLWSGQSNMEWTVRNSANRDAEIQNARHRRIRLFNVPGHTVAPERTTKGRGTWAVCNPRSVPQFSAVGYFFGRRLMHELKCPIGLIGVNWGGTRIEPWTPAEGFQAVPALAQLATQVATTAEKKPKVNGRTPAAIYNSMVHPLVPFAARGVIWYQGESNGTEGETYLQKKRALIAGWRKMFGRELGFYWVQLANYRQPNDKPEGGEGWSKLREAQRMALAIPHTGMAVTIDIGEARDIHPRNKQDVGWRLAQSALHTTYGRKKLVPSGPVYKSHAVEEGAIRVSFDHVGKGLMPGLKNGMAPTRGTRQALRRFAISGADKKWYWAEAKIDGKDVVVRSKDVPKPVAVRYAYCNNPVGANLYNQAGFPASPFRTDNW